MSRRKRDTYIIETHYLLEKHVIPSYLKTHFFWNNKITFHVIFANALSIISYRLATLFNDIVKIRNLQSTTGIITFVMNTANGKQKKKVSMVVFTYTSEVTSLM